MSIRRPQSFLWLALGLLLACGSAPHDTNDPGLDKDRASSQAEPTLSSRALSPGVGGLKIYLDPVTGERRSPPPGVTFPALTPAEQNARSHSHEGLEEVQGANPEDGFMVDLKGRFSSAVVSTRQPDGSFSTRCLGELPDAMRKE